MKDSENRIRNVSLRYLERRQHSRKELYWKLRKKGFSPQEIERELDRLKEIGLINDREFAIQWAIARRRKLYGNIKIKWELEGKGIDRELINEALNEAEKELREEEAARKVASRKKTQPEKIYRFLLQRGFSPEIAGKIALEVKNEIPRD